jgi:hypothetical protein
MPWSQNELRVFEMSIVMQQKCKVQLRAKSKALRVERLLVVQAHSVDGAHQFRVFMHWWTTEDGNLIESGGEGGGGS